ncbi:Choline/Carnitine O-acyltransferase, partial [Dictyocaulus viviparus]
MELGKWEKYPVEQKPLEYLRIHENGFILNTGVTLIFILFSKTFPIKRKKRKIWRVLKQDVPYPHFKPPSISIDLGEELSVESSLVHENRFEKMLYRLVDCDKHGFDGKFFLVQFNTRGPMVLSNKIVIPFLDINWHCGLRHPFFISREEICIEGLIDRILVVYVRRTKKIQGARYRGCRDYETDVHHVDEFGICRMIIMCVCELQVPLKDGAVTQNKFFLCRVESCWNVFKGWIPGGSCRILKELTHSVAFNPGIWYPFARFPIDQEYSSYNINCEKLFSASPTTGRRNSSAASFQRALCSLIACNDRISVSYNGCYMRSKNTTLPKLPVPDPKKTLSHFLNFAEPLQTRHEFERTQLIVNEFAEKELPTLQKLLEQRAAKLNNWLTPWWLNVAYLQSRTPLPVVTSPGLVLPRFSWSDKECQTDIAAKVTQAATKFHLKVLKGELPQDMFGKTPFDMSQYSLIFGTTRIPKNGCDEIRYGCSNENQQRHIIVLHNGHVFTIPVLTNAGQPLPLSTLKTLFKEIVERSPQRLDYSVGIVSSDNRDKWAEIYEQLKAHPSNSINLSCIEDALFAVCLDQEFEALEDDEEKDEFAKQCLHGGGSKSNSCNRWFDKTLQFVIGKNGSVGVTYEHTPAEGPPVATMTDFICDEIYANDFKDDSTMTKEEVKQLDFELNDSQRAQIKRSEKQIDKTADDLDVTLHTFKSYGKNFPKSVGISPDSYIQMAFQLAFHRIHSAVPPTYETATLRKFADGRTENIRSPNVLANVFVKKMTSGHASVTDIYDALKAAADSHKNYT